MDYMLPQQLTLGDSHGGLIFRDQGEITDILWWVGGDRVTQDVSCSKGSICNFLFLSVRDICPQLQVVMIFVEEYMGAVFRIRFQL